MIGRKELLIFNQTLAPTHLIWKIQQTVLNAW